MLTEMVELPEPVMIIDPGQAGHSTRLLFPGHREKLPSSRAVSTERERWGGDSTAGERSHAGQRAFHVS